MPTLTGTVNLFGSGATLTSGDLFNSAMVGHPITIHGHTYSQVETVTDATNLTVPAAEAFEIVENAAYSCTIPDPPPPDPEPLTLGCFCPGDTGVAGCQLVSLTLHVDVINNSSDVKGCIGNMLLTCGVPGTSVNDSYPTPGAFSYDYPLNQIAYYNNWSAISIRLGGDSSLFQIDPHTGASCIFNYYIDQKYVCIDPDRGGTRIVHVRAVDTQSCEANAAVNIAHVGVGGGSATYTKITSTTLSGAFAACAVGGFNNNPTKNTLDGTNNGVWCLCVSGGTPPYKFSIIEGQLPCGQSLNEDSGCVEGNPDGTCAGTQTVTFRVFDQDGNHADVTCNIIEGCPGLNPNVGNWAA